MTTSDNYSGLPRERDVTGLHPQVAQLVLNRDEIARSLGIESPESMSASEVTAAIAKALYAQGLSNERVEKEFHRIEGSATHEPSRSTNNISYIDIDNTLDGK